MNRHLKTGRNGKSNGPAARAAALLAVLALAWLPVGAEAGGAVQDDRQEQIDALSRVLGMTVAEIEALGLSADEIQVLLEGYTEETVVVGTRARPRTVAESPVPVDVLSSSDLTSQGAVNLQDQLRTIVPSSASTPSPSATASTVVRPAMLRNLAPDHTLVLVNGKRRHRSSIIDWHGGNGVAFGSQGPDISAIPAIALRQVEVLRDGGGGAVRLGRHRRRVELPAQGRPLGRRHRAQQRHLRRGRRRGLQRRRPTPACPSAPPASPTSASSTAARTPPTAAPPAATPSRCSRPGTPMSPPTRRRSGARRGSRTI